VANSKCDAIVSMKSLAIALAAVIALAACHKKEAEKPPPKPEEIRAIEKAKETAKKLNEKTKETNEATQSDATQP
jgi:uncharacterized lipoprotein YbaY